MQLLPELKPREQQVCEAYLADGLRSKTKAFREHSGTSASPEAVGKRAHTFFNRPVIREYLRLRKEQLRVKYESNTDRWLQEVARIAFLDPAELLDKDGGLIPMHLLPASVRSAITEFEIVEKDGKTTARVKKLEGKKGALEMLGKFLGAFERDNKQKADAEHDLATEAAAMSNIEIARRILYIIHQANEEQSCQSASAPSS